MLEGYSEYFKQFAEQLARIEHAQWVYWAKGLLNLEPNISDERKAEWRKLFEVDWDDLSQDDKNKDMLWVSQVLSIFERDPFWTFMNILEILLANRYVEGTVGIEVYDPLEHADRDVGVQLIENTRKLIKDIRTAEDKKKKAKEK